jgi:hypothetical protein
MEAMVGMALSVMQAENERLLKLVKTYEMELEFLQEDCDVFESDLERYVKIIDDARKICESSTQELKLHMGEMTAQEVRSVKAALGWVLATLKR